MEGLDIYAGEGPSAPLVFSHRTMCLETHDEKLRIGDGQWTMRVSYGRLLERSGRPFGIFLFGFAIMLLAMQLHRLQQRRVGAFQALADEQALRAAERERMIGEMAPRMKNAFARNRATARFTCGESKSIEEFEVRLDRRNPASADTKT